MMAKVPNVEKAYDAQDTRLLNAARNGEANKISELIKQGFNINETDKNGCTPLIFAAMSGQVEAVKVLLSAGADASIKDRLGYDAYTAAMFFGDFKGVPMPPFDVIMGLLKKHPTS
jgi:ankyrin repeat protein